MLLTIFLLVIGYFVLNKVLEYSADVHPLVLQKQSNISPTRKENETAIYRHNLISHGFPLLTGLNIRNGYRTRNGNFKDVWKVLCDAHSNKSIQFGEKKVTIGQINAAAKTLSLPHGDLGVVLPIGSLYGFTLAVHAITRGLKVHFFDTLPRSNPGDVETLVMLKEHEKFLNGSESWYKNVVFVDTVFSDFDTSDKEFEYEYKVGDKENSMMLTQTLQYRTFKYTHNNLISAVAAQMKSLPVDSVLTEKDTLLITYNDDLNFLVKTLAVMLSGGSVIVDTCLDHKYTILATQTVPLPKSNGIQHFLLSRIKSMVSHGIVFGLNTTPRLFFLTESTSEQINTIRAYYRVRVVKETLAPGFIGPVCISHFYDYRVINESSVSLCGQINICLEAKLVQHDGYDIEKRQGQLCVRGFNIGVPENIQKAIKEGESIGGGEGWMPTGIFGLFGEDGCFYKFH